MQIGQPNPNSVWPRRTNYLSYAWSRFMIGSNAVSAAGVWPAANRALFVPFEVTHPALVTTISWKNGTTSSGNLDVGIYAPNENDCDTVTKIISSGATAQGTVSTVQTANITDTILGRGTYFFGMAFDNGTATILCETDAAAFCNGMGLRQVAAAYTLPATATLAVPASAVFPAIWAAVSPVTL